MTPHILVFDLCLQGSNPLINELENYYHYITTRFNLHEPLIYSKAQLSCIIINLDEIEENIIIAIKKLEFPIGVPILIIANSIDIKHRESLFKLGIQRFLLKPYYYQELLEWINKSLEQEKGMQNPSLIIGNLHLNPLTQKITVNGNFIAFTTAEYQILRILLRSIGTTIKREILYQDALNQPYEFCSRTLDVHISNIRKKLRKEKGYGSIQTIRNIGYVFLNDSAQ